MHEAGRGLITRSSGKAVKGIVMKRVCELAVGHNNGQVQFLAREASGRGRLRKND